MFLYYNKLILVETIIDMNNKHWYNVKDREGIIDRTCYLSTGNENNRNEIARVSEGNSKNIFDPINGSYITLQINKTSKGNKSSKGFMDVYYERQSDL